MNRFFSCLLLTAMTAFFLPRSAFAEYKGDIFKAVAASDSQEVRRAVKEGVSFGAKNAAGENVFEYALMHFKNPVVLKLLIDPKGDYSKPLDKSKKSVLLTALARYPDVEIIEKLLAAKASAKDVDEKNNGALIYAYRYFPEPIIFDMLLKAGAFVDQKDENGQTVLQSAVADNQKRIAEPMLENGADMNLPYADGSMPLERAVDGEFDDIVALLLDFGAELYPENLRDKTLLMKSVQTAKKAKTPRLLIDAGISVQERDAAGKTALMYAAASSKSPAVIDLLLKNGAYPYTKDRRGKNAFDWLKENPLSKKSSAYKKILSYLNSKEYLPDFFELVKYGTPAEVKQAIDEGADVNEADPTGLSPVFLAAQYAFDVNVFDALIKAGAKYDVRDFSGRGPLVYAAVAKNTAVLDRLLALKADVNAVDTHGDTALIFLSQYAQGETDFDIIRKLIEHGADLNAQNVSGRTALMTAAEFGSSPDVIGILLKAGADTSLQTPMGETAADFADGNILLRGHPQYQRLIKSMKKGRRKKH